MVRAKLQNITIKVIFKINFFKYWRVPRPNLFLIINLIVIEITYLEDLIFIGIL